ncbi:MAG: patatin-like phospholipase family protein [Anaerolineae bacterium]|nr:patatin-like phospholipase family protein [Anaerolineae bacterium]
MQYDLVFEGGGAKGMVFVGAMQEFEAQGHTPGRLLGTSAGAITAALLAAGYDSQEMLAALNEKQDGHSVFAAFMGEPAPFPETEVRNSATLALLRKVNIPLLPEFLESKLDEVLVGMLAKQPALRHIFSFIERGGWYSADSFLTWMRRKLDEGVFNGAPRAFSGMTLAQLHAVTQADLSLIASDTTAGSILVLNHRTAPDCPVVWAVRMSMNIPLLWQEVIWLPEWGLYRGKPLAGHAIVDGGMLSNFPMELFVSSLASVTAVMGDKVSERVLGLLIDESAPVPGIEPPAAPDAQALSLGSLQTLQRLMNLVNTMMQAHDKMVIDAFSRYVLRLPARGYGTTEFDMTDERREILVAAGREMMRRYLDEAADEMVSFGVPDAEAAAQAAAIADRLAGRLLS